MFDINWELLGAAELPALLRTIQSLPSDKENDEKLRESWNRLHELLFPEGIVDYWDWGAPERMMRNELPHQVVPFLIEMLEETTSKANQAGIIELLGQLATYEKYKLWVGKPGQPKYETYIEWSKRLKDILRKGIPAYKKLLGDEYPYLDHDVQKLLRDLGES